jgi:DNA polymerase I-like protein with 3'-5' exonuclease and polymerase domains
VRGQGESADALRGTGEVIDGVRYFYTLDPQAVYRDSSSLDAYMADVAKAFKFFSGTLRVPDIAQTTHHDPSQWLAAVRTLKEPRVFDFETPVANPVDVAKSWPLMIAAGDADHAHVLVLHDYTKKVLYKGSEANMRQAVADALTAYPWHGHNASVFDTVVARVHFGVTPWLASDTLIDHVSTFTEDNRHNLGWVVSELTLDCEPWKADKTATRGAPYQEVVTYAGKDAQKNAWAVGPLDVMMRKRYQTDDLTLRREREMIVARLGADMQVAGCRVDLSRMAAMEAEYTAKTREAAAACQAIFPAVNPASAVAVAKHLYVTRGLPVVETSTTTGAPSTAESALTQLILAGIDDTDRRYIEALLAYRDVSKVVSTYLTGMKEHLVGDRLHGSFTRLPVTGRYSCKDPNMQNWPKFLRKLIIARPGYILIGADSDQLEARIMADLCGARTLWKAIRENLCIHNERMAIVYGDGIWKTPGAPASRAGKGSGRFALLRHLIKRVGYLRQYGGGVEKLLATIKLERVKPETPDGSWYPFRTMTRREVREILDKFRVADPEIEEWWDQITDGLASRGYVEEPFWGRRRFLPPWASPTAAYNFPIQAGGAAIMHEATIELVEGAPRPWFCTEATCSDVPGRPLADSRARLIAQIHDQNLLEVPLSEADYWAARLQQCMTRRRKNHEMVYSAIADRGRSWYGVDHPGSEDAIRWKKE